MPLRAGGGRGAAPDVRPAGRVGGLGGDPMTENANAAVYFVDRHLEEGRAGKTAYREAAGKRREITYGELARCTGRVAGAMAANAVRRRISAMRAGASPQSPCIRSAARR